MYPCIDEKCINFLSRHVRLVISIFPTSNTDVAKGAEFMASTSVELDQAMNYLPIVSIDNGLLDIVIDLCRLRWQQLDRDP